MFIMPLTTKVCPKCAKGILFAKPILNMFGKTEGYQLDCPLCEYISLVNTIESNGENC